jgi:hypothetical protein
VPKKLLLKTSADWQLHTGKLQHWNLQYEAISLLPNCYKLVRTMLRPKCLQVNWIIEVVPFTS